MPCEDSLSLAGCVKSGIITPCNTLPLQRTIGHHDAVEFVLNDKKPTRKDMVHPHWVFFVGDNNQFAEEPDKVFLHDLSENVSRARVITFHRLRLKRMLGKVSGKKKLRRKKKPPLHKLRLDRVVDMKESYIIPWAQMDQEQHKHHIHYARDIIRARIGVMLADVDDDITAAFIDRILQDDCFFELIIAAGTVHILRSDMRFWQRLAQTYMICALNRQSLLNALRSQRKQQGTFGNTVLMCWNSGSINTKLFDGKLSAPRALQCELNAAIVPRLEPIEIFKSSLTRHLMEETKPM